MEADGRDDLHARGSGRGGSPLHRHLGASALIQGDGAGVLARDLRARREDGDPTIYKLDVWGGINSFSFCAVGDGISRLVEVSLEQLFRALRGLGR